MVRLLIAFLPFICAAAWPSTEPLDPAYRNLIHPVDAGPLDASLPPLPSRSNVVHVINLQTPVKSQQSRGTCSVFSSTALLESMLVVNRQATQSIDLSEEWLQYLTTLTLAEEGSTSPANFGLLRKFGQPFEAQMPYIGVTWPNKSQGLAQKRCGHLPRGVRLKACLISHRDPELMSMSDADLLNPISMFYDPEFVTARRQALANRSLFFAMDADGDGIIRRTREIQELLLQGIPLALDLNFFNGAWNYPGSARLGIYRSEQLWRQGVVTHPEPGSVDRVLSPQEGEGHSVVVVGYDNDREVEYWMSMEDGSRKKFKRRGVYYFKNSWGASKWGREFTIDGQRYPGYGMILQVHAHAHGQFYRLNMKF